MVWLGGVELVASHRLRAALLRALRRRKSLFGLLLKMREIFDISGDTTHV
jgi:hypothetical protein